MGVEVVRFTDAQASERFRRSMSETGFAVLVDHPVDPREIESLEEEWLGFFSSGRAAAYAARDGRQDGFFANRAENAAAGRDAKEYFQVQDGGSYPAEVSDAAVRYFDSGRELASRLLGWLDAPDHAAPRLSVMLEGSTGSTLRIQHYLPIPGAGPSTGLRALTHTDLNLITLLPAPREPGLQVQDSSGEWHDVPVSSGALVVNGGEMLELATGGRYPATPHRVVNPRSGDSLGSRLSMPMFLHPAPEVVLTPGVTASDFLARRVAELRALGWTPAPGGTDRQDDRSADVDRTIRDAVLAVSGTGPDHATAEVDEVLGQLDSLAMVELIARLESDLDLPIPAAAIQPENFASVDSIRALCGDLTRLQGQR